eukprot:4581574-Amphidinium_carterae.1
MATTKAATDKWGPPVARVARVSCRGPRMTVAKVEAVREWANCVGMCPGRWHVQDAEEASAPKGLCQDVTAALQQAQRGDQVIMEVDQLGNDPLQRVVMAPFDGETICFDKPVMEAGQQACNTHGITKVNNCLWAQVVLGTHRDKQSIGMRPHPWRDHTNS